MERYLITKSLVSSWAYAVQAGTDEAFDKFMRVLRREPSESTEAMAAGLAFEALCYRVAMGQAGKPDPNLVEGAKEIASVISGGAYQIRASREIEVDRTTYLVYGILDVLKAGTIYDIKFATKPLWKRDIYGKYLESPQHPFYLHIVPEAQEFTYLLSDGKDVYKETYRREECPTAEEVIREFVTAMERSGLLDEYKKHWLAL